MKFVTYREWKQLPECANILFARCEQDSLFFSRVWLESLTSHALNAHQSILLACVVKDENFLAILPLMQHPQGNLSSLSNHYTTLYSLLISDNGQQDAILACLANGLSQMPVQLIQFEPIDANDDIMIRLCELMGSCGFQSYPYFRFYNWIHPANGQSFDEYMDERPAILRNTIRRKQRKLKREHDYAIQLFKYADIEQALLDYCAIYKASWKANEFYAAFTPSLVKSLSQLGWLRLGILYIKEQPVAAQIWFVLHGKANIYRLVYDMKWKKYSPGSILTQYLIRYVIDIDKVSEIDFLTGNEHYKQDWMTVRRERLGVRFVKQSEQQNRFSRTIRFAKKLLSHS